MSSREGHADIDVSQINIVRQRATTRGVHRLRLARYAMQGNKIGIASSILVVRPFRNVRTVPLYL
eukprot:8906034-Pyramimonas_sp.AAC.1